MDIRLTILLSFYFSISFSQTQVKDSLNNQYIPNVEVYSNKGSLIAISDKKGKFNLQAIQKIKEHETDELFLVHPSYKVKQISKNVLTLNTVILQPRIVELDEVILTKNNASKYHKIKVYYRSFQINNNQIHYFTDGIADYYIANKSKNIKVDVLQNRCFENTSVKQLDEEGSLKLDFQLTGVPDIDDNLVDFSQNFKISEIDNINIIIEKNKNEAKGTLNNVENKTELNLTIISDDFPKVMGGFGVENILHNYNVNALYNAKSIDSIGLERLMYSKQTRKYSIKKSKDKEYQTVDCIHEIFVLNHDQVNEMNKNELDRYYVFGVFKTPFEKYWENIKNALYQKLPESVENFIEKNLKQLN